MPPVDPGWSRERCAAGLGFRAVAGIDEAGRGALAGPVVAAAVILDLDQCPPGVRDSKLVSPAARERLYARIVGCARGWSVGVSDAAEIDAAGILEATRRAMMRAVEGLAPGPDYLIIDAVPLPGLGLPFESPTKADRDIISVAAASILAKVTRDRMMIELDRAHGGYGFATHKGYGTRAHFEALALLGPAPSHRKTFRPVADAAQEPILKVSTLAGSIDPASAGRPAPRRGAER